MMPIGMGTDMIVVVMGVAGCGKTSVGERLAERLGWAMLEGDAFHPQANKDKMAGGTPLTDEDRWPWLDEIAREMRRHDGNGESAIVTCSALKRSYRDRLRRGAADVRFVHLTGSRDVHEERIRTRTGHFMPASMLDSQLATLEPPGAQEAAIAVDIDQPLEAIADQVLDWLN
jgi:carbohydrate kinase (thermoresistant glucokinase family)